MTFRDDFNKDPFNKKDVAWLLEQLERDRKYYDFAPHADAAAAALKHMKFNAWALSEVLAGKKLEDVYLDALKEGKIALADIPRNKQTFEIQATAIEIDPFNLKDVHEDDRSEGLNVMALKQDGMVLGVFPVPKRKEYYCAIAIDTTPRALEHVPEDGRTDYIKRRAVASALIKASEAENSAQGTAYAVAFVKEFELEDMLTPEQCTQLGMAPAARTTRQAAGAKPTI